MIMKMLFGFLGVIRIDICIPLRNTVNNRYIYMLDYQAKLGSFAVCGTGRPWCFILLPLLQGDEESGHIFTHFLCCW